MRIIVTLAILASLCWAGQYVIVSGEAVFARRNAAIEAMADQSR